MQQQAPTKDPVTMVRSPLMLEPTTTISPLIVDANIVPNKGTTASATLETWISYSNDKNNS